MSSQNPFDELELDPRLSPDELTDALRRRAEKAEGAERARIQEIWRLLTVNERERVRWAFFAHPRAADGDARTVDALRDKVPPVISRKQPGAAQPQVQDALAFPQRSDQSRLVPSAPFDQQ